MQAPNPVMPDQVPTKPVIPNPVIPTAVLPTQDMPGQVPPSQIPTPMTPELQVNPPEKKSNFLLIFIVVIILTLVIGILVGYYLSSTNSIPDNLLPEVDQTPEVTITQDALTTTPSDRNPSITPTQVELSKEFSITFMPWEYSFNYPSTWSENEIANDSESVTVSFSKDSTGCAEGEVICSMVFSLQIAAEMVDQSVSTQIETEEFVLQREGPVNITLYQYISSGTKFLMVPIRDGWMLANVAQGKEEEAKALFKQILGSYFSDESTAAL